MSEGVETSLTGRTDSPTEIQPGDGGPGANATTADVLALKKRGNPFLPGHPKWGGRKKGVKNKRTKLAQDMAAEMGADPVKFMLTLLASDSVQVTEVNPDTGKPVLDDKGKPKKSWVAIPLDMKLDAAKAVAAYVHPKLQATQVTGANDGPIETTTLDLTAIMGDPRMAEAAQQLAMMVAEQDARTIESGDESEDD